MSQTELESLVAFLVIGPMIVIGGAALAQMVWWDFQDEKLEREKRERLLQEREKMLQQLEDDPATPLTKAQFRLLLRQQL